MLLPTQPKSGIEYVDTAEALEKVLERMAAVDTVYFDLEADSMHHYYAKICLIQILADGHCFLVDPLSGVPLESFLKALSGKVMILHGADYDLRMLYQGYGFRPFKVFDTMLAAQLLGKPAFGLAALVQAYFGITLRKEQQKADWSVRPLSAGMLEYGAQDTYFLPGLYETLTAELSAKGRLAWHEETCAELVKATARSKEVDVENIWRIDGSSKLYPRQLAALQRLWKYRDEAAKAQDLPSYKILPSDLLMRFALVVPPDGRPVQVPTLPSRLNPAFKTGYLAVFEEALNLPASEWPQPLKFPKKPNPSPNPMLLAHLKQVRDKIAADLALDPSLLATKSILTSVALSGCGSRQKISEAAKWMKWQEGLLLDPWLASLKKS